MTEKPSAKKQFSPEQVAAFQRLGLPGKLRRDDARLVKFPVIFDAVPEPPDDLGDYLQAWMEKEQ